MKGIKFITGHMNYKPAYNQILQTLETNIDGGYQNVLIFLKYIKCFNISNIKLIIVNGNFLQYQILPG